MKKLQIAVLFGGVSTEHRVSCTSATTIIKSLDTTKYQVLPVGITEEGQMLYFEGDIDTLADGSWQQGPVTPCNLSTNRTCRGLLLDHGATLGIDCVIPVLHGKNGEDGTIQGLLQLANIPFVGCDTISSANCMDKELTHIILAHAGIPMANWVSVTATLSTEEQVARVENALPYPVFVKPANAGSSFGVSKADDRAALLTALTLAFSHDRKVIVEEMLVGKEVECAVLGSLTPEASTIGEIEPAGEFYDFDAKYVNPASLLHIPARLPIDTIETLRKTAIQAYLAMGCGGLSRVDFFATEDGRFWLNEINTFPGFTSISMYPKLWEASGVSIATLLDRLIADGMERTNG